MNILHVLVILILSLITGKEPRSEMYNMLFMQKTSINWIYRESITVLSGDIVQLSPTTASLINLEIHKGDGPISDTIQIDWSGCLITEFNIGDRVLVFADSSGSIGPAYVYGIHHPGCVEILAFKHNPHSQIVIAPHTREPLIITDEYFYLLKQGKCIEPVLIPVQANLHFPVTGDSISIFIEINGDSMLTSSEHTVLDSCQVEACFSSQSIGITFLSWVKKNRNLNRTRIRLMDGRNLTYKDKQFSVDYCISRFRSLEEFLDYASTGHVQEYNIEIVPDEDLFENNLNGRMYFSISSRWLPGLTIADSLILDHSLEPADNLDFAHGYVSYSLPSTGLSIEPRFIIFQFADSASMPSDESSGFLEMVSKENFIGDILLLASGDSIPEFYSHFKCIIDEYDNSVSNKDSTELVQHMYLQQEYGDRKPLYFRSTPGDSIIFTIEFTESMNPDTSVTYAWLEGCNNTYIHPININIVAGEIGSARTKFTYTFDIPDTLSGRLLLDFKGLDSQNDCTWWSFGRSYYGIIDLIIPGEHAKDPLSGE